MNQLKIAIQKSGRLSEDSLALFKECGIKFSDGQRKLKSQALNFPIEFLFFRDDDIPGYVEDGVADLGILGQNVFREAGKDILEIKTLGFSKCRMSLAIPKAINYTGLNYFEGKYIATSYPSILTKFLNENNISAEVHKISGSVEIAPSIGLADGILDIVSTGSTLISNGLKEVETILHSEAILVSNKHLNDDKKELITKLLFRINAVLSGKNHKYVLMNAPNDKLDDILAVLPGMRSPTVLPLAEKGWSSIHSVLSEDTFWNNIEKLRAAGAEGLLVVPIEKMIR
ncbi:MAG: ATP phosphoribosyltransferase [Flammeovirgaceae bacterium]|jgi:ATP phosphoribosyltransferase|nr:ATP phosphoribosyltransferase [Flammeovirgaceae bacterium]|tara:strand:- start:12277 stop:13134 length:858 start_codon:yes stop_codon:yes gene_type:complete